MKLSKEQQEAMVALKKAFGFKSVVINGITIDNITLGLAEGFVSTAERVGFMELELHRMKSSMTTNTAAFVPDEVAKSVGLEMN